MNHTRSVNPRDRIDWVDYAKGICIIWVVTLYATDYVKEITHSIGWMQAIVDFAQPFRMPDFFLLSGLFVPRVLQRSWGDYLDSKVVHFVYFYAVWGALKLLNLHWDELQHLNFSSFALDYLRIFIVPPTGPLWFIYELPMFFLAIRLVRRIHPAIVLAVAVALQMAVTWGEVEWSIKIADKFARYFVFFYSGYLLSGRVFQIMGRLRQRLWLTIGILACWAITNQAMVSLHATFLPGMQLLLGYAGAFGLQLSATVVARSPGANWLRYLGRNSIVVYLGFVIPLGLTRQLIDQAHLMLDLGTFSVLVIAASVGGSILLYLALRNTPFAVLYRRPSWLERKRSAPGVPPHPSVTR